MIPLKPDFRKASASAVKDSDVIAAVRKTATLLVSKRAAAVADAKDFEAEREEGRRLKMEVSADLGGYSRLFAQNAEKAGAKVHFAATGEEASAIALKIAKAHAVSTAVKGKSMTAEEAGLNELFHEAGVEVTETDLGEFIIQLADEAPSHIMAPAIHRNRAQVAQLFAEKLGVPPNLGVEELVAAARAALRQKFLSAGMGITGGNFAVAETGSLVLVSNEGNIRMATSLPKVMVALVGIDKVIPSLADVPKFLSLLARSASGQVISSYMSIVTGPRKTAEDEGPEEVHIILLDNRRSTIAKGPYREICHCLHCGACLSHCPVYRAVGGHAFEAVYPGPMGSVISPLIFGVKRYSDLPFACTQCGRCGEICPAKIPLPDYLRALRTEAKPATTMMRLGAFGATHPLLYRLGMARLRKALKSGGFPMDSLLAEWKLSREAPKPEEGRDFRSWWKEHKGL